MFNGFDVMGSFSFFSFTYELDRSARISLIKLRIQVLKKPQKNDPDFFQKNVAALA